MFFFETSKNMYVYEVGKIIKHRKFDKIFYSFIGVILFIGAWELLRSIKRDVALISTFEIGKALVKIITDFSFYGNLFSTIKIVLLGILFAIIFGFTVGVFLDMSKTANSIVMPIIEMLRNIPSITLFPILLVMYGIGDTARIFVIFWTATPAILLATLFGLKSVDYSIIEAAMTEGAKKSCIMRRIKIPLAIPEILNGIKIGIGSGFVAIVVAEMLGASKGLGFMVLWSTNAFKYNETYAYILIIALVGAFVNMIMSVVIKKYERDLL